MNRARPAGARGPAPVKQIGRRPSPSGKPGFGPGEYITVTRKWRDEESRHFDAYDLAKANKRRHVRIINARLDLPMPEIVKPLELFTEADHADE